MPADPAREPALDPVPLRTPSRSAAPADRGRITGGARCAPELPPGTHHHPGSRHPVIRPLIRDDGRSPAGHGAWRSLSEVTAPDPPICAAGVSSVLSSGDA